jgi:hypothetical protein
VLDGARDPHDVAGRFREPDGSHHVGAERRWAGPDELPAPPYHVIDVAEYLHPTVLGRRSACTRRRLAVHTAASSAA